MIFFEILGRVKFLPWRRQGLASARCRACLGRRSARWPRFGLGLLATGFPGGEILVWWLSVFLVGYLDGFRRLVFLSEKVASSCLGALQFLCLDFAALFAGEICENL